VLIVDDHPGFRAQARVPFVAASYEVVGGSAEGESGTRVAGDLTTDVVLLAWASRRRAAQVVAEIRCDA